MPDTSTGIVTISTRAVRGHERVDFWVDHVARSLVRIECSGKSSDGIDATLRKRDLALFSACDIVANRHAVVRTPHNIHADQRDAVFICLMHAGQGYTFQDVECMQHAPGDIVLYDTSMPYGHGFPADMAMTVLDVPRDVFEARVGPWRYRGVVKIDRDDGVTSWAARQIHALLAEPHSPAHEAHDGRERRAAAVLDLVRSMLRLRDGDASPTKSTVHTLSRAKAFIESHLDDDALDCHAVSRAIRLSPRQLARIFEIEGMPLTRYILARRLERCRADLRDRSLKHLTVSEIAFRWGFNNSAHFSRSYRARFGETPSDTRAPDMPR
ncbi:helix-turn-helix domain-containing protein [Burkholderia pseudomultivorans]|uniref:AraC family transcriptional regulator n=1 Tax=Burkholderia pseudomultivorans TaxID=1207504 RepID=A0A132F2I4_9BURK|nr:helix-turn-helix domain-containing protein [Burkholderia pseudomultivorans]KWF67738.1 AraC family transcriptional regulator [Burkholderia pseudomultivorans]MBF5008515.1 helix-turn-helix domain-containing protein [Burkholderia pseudomultivorans]